MLKKLQLIPHLYLFTLNDVQHLPASAFQVLCDITPVAPPGGSLSTEDCGNTFACQFFEPQEGMPEILGAGKFLVAARTVPTKLAHPDIADIPSLREGLEILPREVLKPARRKASYINQQLDAKGVYYLEKAIQAAIAGTNGIYFFH
jgi:hypothetical protein